MIPRSEGGVIILIYDIYEGKYRGTRQLELHCQVCRAEQFRAHPEAGRTFWPSAINLIGSSFYLPPVTLPREENNNNNNTLDLNQICLFGVSNTYTSLLTSVAFMQSSKQQSSNYHSVTAGLSTKHDVEESPYRPGEYGLLSAIMHARMMLYTLAYGGFLS